MRKRSLSYTVHKIGPKQWHGYAMGQDVYAETKSELLDKMYRMEHGGISKAKRRRWNPGAALGAGTTAAHFTANPEITDKDFLELLEIEIQQDANRTWSAYRFGILIAHGSRSRKELIVYLRRYFKYNHKNPGAAWHRDKMDYHRQHKEWAKWVAHSDSADESEKIGLRNPGAAWHEKEIATIDDYVKRRGGDEFLRGNRAAHVQSRSTSKFLGIPNPSPKSKLSKWILPAIAVIGAIWYLKKENKI